MKSLEEIKKLLAELNFVSGVPELKDNCYEIISDLVKEVETINAVMEFWKQDSQKNSTTAANIFLAHSNLQSKLDEAKAALEWYTDAEEWESFGFGRLDSKFDKDTDGEGYGARARNVLKRLK